MDTKSKESWTDNVVNWILSLESDQKSRKPISLFIKIFGILNLVGFCIFDITFTVLVLTQSSQDVALLMPFFVYPLTIFTGIVLTKIVWDRANKIREVNSDGEFSLRNVSSTLIRLWGECAFIVGIGTGIKLFVLLILAIIPQLGRSYPRYEGPTYIFLASVGFLASGAALFAISHVVAGLVNRFSNMATSLKKIEEKL